jgi:hypothetical protein
LKKAKELELNEIGIRPERIKSYRKIANEQRERERERE